MPFEKVRSITVTPVSTAVPANRLVTIGTNGAATLATAGGDAVGIVLEASAADSTSAISIGLLDGGKIEVEANGAITAGAAVAVAGTGADAGRVATATANSTTRQIGYALEAATAAGEIITVLTSKASAAAALS